MKLETYQRHLHSHVKWAMVLHIRWKESLYWCICIYLMNSNLAMTILRQKTLLMSKCTVHWYFWYLAIKVLSETWSSAWLHTELGQPDLKWRLTSSLTVHLSVHRMYWLHWVIPPQPPNISQFSTVIPSRGPVIHLGSFWTRSTITGLMFCPVNLLKGIHVIKGLCAPFQ